MRGAPQSERLLRQMVNQPLVVVGKTFDII